MLRRSQLTMATSICIALWIVAIAALPTHAQVEGIAEYVPIADSEVTDGDIITFTNGRYERARTPYDSNLIGVINTEPAIALNTRGPDSIWAVVTHHTVQTNVSNANGHIRAGDFITSSNEAGIGIKATTGGTVIGTALASFEPQDQRAVGQIPVEINITYAVPNNAQPPDKQRSTVGQFLRILTSGAQAAAAEPSTALRYIIAAIVLILSMGFGFLVFGRTAVNGIIAIGRNPLARRSIILAIFFNVLITVTLVASGLALSLLILTA